MSLVGLRLCSVLLWKACRCILCMLVCLRGNWQAIFEVGMHVSVKVFWINRWRGTVSKVLPMSMAALSVLGAGFRWLKSSVKFCVRFVRTVLVEGCGLKQCCVGQTGMLGLMLLSTSLSSIFDEWQRRRSGGRWLVRWGVCWV